MAFSQFIPRISTASARIKKYLPIAVSTAAWCASSVVVGGNNLPQAYATHADNLPTRTPIKHVVVLYPENISFDHYFGTYPYAENNAGEKLQGHQDAAAHFHPQTGTKIPNNYLQRDARSLKQRKKRFAVSHPHVNGGFIPFRLSPQQALTCDQNHHYTAEQQAFNNGKMDKFYEVNAQGNSDCKNPSTMTKRNDLVMGYYDGNTVTSYWNLAQHFVLNDNNYGSVFGPSAPGHLNLVSGQTSYARAYDPVSRKIMDDLHNKIIAPKNGIGTFISDRDPLYDDCSNHNGLTSSPLVDITAPNIGDLLNMRNISWGWFQGGFRPNSTRDGGKHVNCNTAHKNVGGLEVRDYSPHHQPFQYFKTTANPHHLPPTAADMIGKSDQANHQYDLEDFYTALATHNLPAISFVKPPAYQDGHAEYSDPVDENQFAARLVNQLQQSDEWSSTALIIAYDDSDGWYDHQPSPILNGSHTPQDAAICTRVEHVIRNIQGRCGPGTRHPFLIVSPYVGKNVLNSTHTEQASVIKFIEDNWKLPRLGKGSFDERAGSINSMFRFHHKPRTDKVWLDETTGAITTKDKVTPLHPGTITYQNSSAGKPVSPFEKYGKPIIFFLSLAVFGAGGIYLLSRKHS